MTITVDFDCLAWNQTLSIEYFFSFNTIFHLSKWALTLKFIKDFSIVAIFKTEKVKYFLDFESEGWKFYYLFFSFMLYVRAIKNLKFVRRFQQHALYFPRNRQVCVSQIFLMKNLDLQKARDWSLFCKKKIKNFHDFFAKRNHLRIAPKMLKLIVDFLYDF